MSFEPIEFGRTGIKINRIGLGLMPVSIFGRPDQNLSIELIRRSIDLGVNFLDGADAYCLDEDEKHFSEHLIHRALDNFSTPNEVLIATKGGLIRPGGAWKTDLDPSRLRIAIRESFKALGGEKAIPLWQIHNAPQDDRFSFSDIFAPIVEAIRSNLIRFVGLSNFNLEQIIEAQKFVEIQSIQNRFSFFHREKENEEILKYCEQNRMTFIGYSPFGGRRKHKQIVKQKILVELGEKYRCSAHCVVLSWILSKSNSIITIPGATRICSIEDSIRALKIQLEPSDIEKLNKL